MDLTEKDIKVSVVMAVYNTEKYLRDALDSVCAQTLRGIEIICVDDGSTDASYSIMEEYALIDERITVLQQKEQSDGAAAARNMGLQHAKGEYLCVLDSDDFFEPDMLEKAYQKALETNSDIVIYDGYVFDEKIMADIEVGYILTTEYLPKGKDVFVPEENADNLFQMTNGAAWNLLIKRKLIVDNKLEFRSFHFVDDFVFTYLATVCAKKIAVLPKHLIHYRKNHSESQTSHVGKWPEVSYKALKKLKEELVSRGLYEKYKVSFVQYVMELFIYFLNFVKNYEGFALLYNEFKNKYFDELDVFNVPEDKYRNPYWVKTRDAIRDMEISEYLYKSMYDPQPFEKCQEILIGAKVIIYGAGNIGSDIFSRAIREKNFRIQAWVDMQYEKIGYPVASPEVIKTLDFDYVLIAVAARGSYHEICNYLLKCGVEKEKICWIGDE